MAFAGLSHPFSVALPGAWFDFWDVYIWSGILHLESIWKSRFVHKPCGLPMIVVCDPLLSKIWVNKISSGVAVPSYNIPIGYKIEQRAHFGRVSF